MSLAMDFQAPGASVPLAHPVDAMASGPVPDAMSGTFGLSIADARVALFMKWYGEGGSLVGPSMWIEVAPDCVSFIVLADGCFLCASTCEGLVLVSPQ